MNSCGSVPKFRPDTTTAVLPEIGPWEGAMPTMSGGFALPAADVLKLNVYGRTSGRPVIGARPSLTVTK